MSTVPAATRPQPRPSAPLERRGRVVRARWLTIRRALHARRVALLCTLGCSLLGGIAPSSMARAVRARAVRAGAAIDQIDRDVIALINALRGRYHVRPLRDDRRLDTSASYHSHEMLTGGYFGHQSLNGSSFGQRMTHFIRARRVGETIAWMSGLSGSQSEIIVNAWMHSPEHRAALLSRAYSRIGVARLSGLLQGSPGTVFTADLAS